MSIMYYPPRRTPHVILAIRLRTKNGKGALTKLKLEKNPAINERGLGVTINYKFRLCINAKVISEIFTSGVKITRIKIIDLD